MGINQAIKRDDRDLGSATTDVQHHGATRFVYRYAGADGGCHWLFYQENLTSAGTLGRLLDGFAFHLG